MKSILLSSLLGLTILNSSITFTASLPKSVAREPIQEYQQVAIAPKYSDPKVRLVQSDSYQGIESIRTSEAQKVEEKKASEEKRIREETEKKAEEERIAQIEAAKSAQKTSFTPSKVSSSAPIVPSSDTQIYAQQRVCAVWGCDQWNAFHFIILKESTWNYRAINPTSGAGGLCQALPFSKMSSAGADYQTNPNTQIEWCISYISGRYKTPEGAKSFWTTNNWF
jgi:Transglycosylase SLT domain